MKLESKNYLTDTSHPEIIVPKMLVRTSHKNLVITYIHTGYIILEYL